MMDQQLLLEARDLSVSFGDRTLFTLPRLALHAGDRVGLVGRNGCGKSTLLALLAGTQMPDTGHVERLTAPGYAAQFGAGEQEDTDRRALKDFGMRDKQGRSTLSGGETARLRLSRTPFGCALLLLDEPTANLDLAGRELFADKLRGQESFLLVSHDRALLDETCNTIWLMENGTIRVYAGNYSDFERARELEKLTQERAHDRYVAEKEAITGVIRGLNDKSASIRRTPARMGNSEARLHKMGGQGAKKKLDQQRKAAQSRLERLEVVDRVRELPPIQLDFSLTFPPEVRTVIAAKGLSYGYPGQETLLRDASFTVENGRKTALLGPNGCGKTTLLRLVREGHDGIRVTPRARLGFLTQDLSAIDSKRTVLENARTRCVQQEDVLRKTLCRLLIPKETWSSPAGSLSGGEKIKLMLCQLIVSDCNVLVLDEPTNWLDLPSLKALEAVLREYPGTVLLVSHDTAFVENVCDRLLRLEDGRITSFAGSLAEEAAARKVRADDGALSQSILQMRMAELSQRISSAPEKEKDALEKAYADCLAQLRGL